MFVYNHVRSVYENQGMFEQRAAISKRPEGGPLPNDDLSDSKPNAQRPNYLASPVGRDSQA